jgi:Cu(I)-responsive transcriptional regulator
MHASRIEPAHFNIGAAAEASGLSAKMIRHYESLSLISRAGRSPSNYRVYSENDIHTLRFIKRARGLGFSLTEVETLLGLWRSKRRSSQQVKQLADKHIAELDQKIAELQSMRKALSQLAHHCHGDEKPECPILDDLSSGVES